jgi:hypothetical protein
LIFQRFLRKNKMTTLFALRVDKSATPFLWPVFRIVSVPEYARFFAYADQTYMLYSAKNERLLLRT